MPAAAASTDGPDAEMEKAASPTEAARHPQHGHRGKGRPSRPEVARAAVTSGFLLLTTLLLTKGVPALKMKGEVTCCFCKYRQFSALSGTADLPQHLRIFF